jgi:endonuclease-3
MPATTSNKQQVLTHLLGAVKLPDTPELSKRPILEEIIYSLCREGSTTELADQAFRRLQTQFFDWNEIRVSSVAEVEEALVGLADAHGRAQRIISLLQEVFEESYSFDLDGLVKKGAKQAAKDLLHYQAVGDYAIAWLTQRTLGGHAIPVDVPTLRVMRRLGLVDEHQDNPEAVRGSLEHAVQKAKGIHVCEAVSHLAKDVCWEDVPNCANCPMHEVCPSAQQTQRQRNADRPNPRLKPR